MATKYNGISVYLGTFKTEKDAHTVFKKAQTEAFRNLYEELTGLLSMGTGPQMFLSDDEFQKVKTKTLREEELFMPPIVIYQNLANFVGSHFVSALRRQEFTVS